MSVYVIVQGRIENRGLLDQYVEKAGPAIKSHQGRTIAFDEEPEVVEGKIEYPRTVIVEFPSMTAFRAWYDSPEYQEILPLRLKATRGTLIVANCRRLDGLMVSSAPPPLATHKIEVVEGKGVITPPTP